MPDDTAVMMAARVYKWSKSGVMVKVGDLVTADGKRYVIRYLERPTRRNPAPSAVYVQGGSREPIKALSLSAIDAEWRE